MAKNNNYVRSHLPAGAYQKPLPEVLSAYSGRNASRLNWSNLRKNLCPKCEGDFATATQNYFVLEHSCGFKISTKKFQKIVSERVNAGIPERRERSDDEL